jgi:glucokinase
VAIEIKKYLGIDIGGMSLKANLIDKTGKIYDSFTVPTNSNWYNQDFLNACGLLLEHFKINEFESIGLGTPGPIDLGNGEIIFSSNLPNIKNLPIVNYFQKNSNKTIYFNNDANCAALGEYYFGSKKNCKDLIVLTLGTGLGVGWVHSGKIYNGYEGNGMEAGHQTIVIDGARCGCGGNGCAEAYFSTRGFLGRYKEKTEIELNNAKDFFGLVERNDPIAIEVLEFANRVLANAIRNLVHTINPERIVLVGGITKSKDLFFNDLKSYLKTIIFPVLWDRLTIDIGESSAGQKGAACLCF